MPNFATNPWDRDAFWRAAPSLPPGLALQRQHTVWFSGRPGPGGADTFELVTLRAPAADSKLLVAYKAPLTAKDIPGLKKRLVSVLDERRRNVTDDEDREPRVPVVVTDSAQPAVRAACEREWLGLIDMTGTLLIHEGPVYVHVEGSHRVRKSRRTTLFRGKGARILRLLLDAPGKPLALSEVVGRTKTSKAYAFAVLTRLEEEGFVQRYSPRTGFRLIRPVELLRAWIDSHAQAAAAVEPFYAPSTSPADLQRVTQRLQEAQTPFALTLMSGVRDDSVVTGGLPHGIYLSGDARAVVEVLQLRKTTPHNFLILRPEPDAATSSCGVYRVGQRSVSTPQLVLDLVANGGPRGREQADAVLDQWARQLPVIGAE